MTPVVLIHIRGGIPTIVGGTKELKVVFLDYDYFDPHPSYYSQVVNVPMSEKQIIHYINQELDDTNTIDK